MSVKPFSEEELTEIREKIEWDSRYDDTPTCARTHLTAYPRINVERFLATIEKEWAGRMHAEAVLEKQRVQLKNSEKNILLVLEEAINWVRIHTSGINAPNEEDSADMREWVRSKVANTAKVLEKNK